MRALQTRRGPAPAAAVPVTGTRAALPAAVLLDGVVPVEGRRVWAHLIDAALVTVAGLVTIAVANLAGLTMWSAALLGALVAVGVLTAVLLRFTGVGRTPGLRALGLRVVDGGTALPPRLTRSPAALVADLRAGRDPLRLQPTQTVTSATSETGRWQDLGETRRHVVRLTIDDGTTFTITGPTLIGRDPVPPAGSVWEVHAIPDLTRTIAKNHALVEPQGADGVWVTDLGSGNGTTGLPVGGPRQPVAKGARVAVPTGGRIAVGSRLLLVAAEKEPGR